MSHYSERGNFLLHWFELWNRAHLKWTGANWMRYHWPLRWHTLHLLGFLWSCKSRHIFCLGCHKGVCYCTRWVVCLWQSLLKQRGTALSVCQPSTQGETNKQINNVGWDRRQDGTGREVEGVGGQDASRNPSGAPCQPVHLKLMPQQTISPLRRALMSMRLAWERRRGGTNRWPTRPGWGSYLLSKGVFCLHVWDMGISETIVLWVMPGLLWTAWGKAYYPWINSVVIVYSIWCMLSRKVFFFFFSLGYFVSVYLFIYFYFGEVFTSNIVYFLCFFKILWYFK